MTPNYDVAIAGYGPVGQLLATLLGQRGHRVIAVERYADFYPMPRAVHFDHEVARILQSVDIRSDTDPIIEPYDAWYEWKNAERKTLLKVDWRGVGPSWWHTSNFFSQPDLERALDLRARRNPSVTVLREHTVVGLQEESDGVRLSLSSATGTQEITARYVVGCDGANSTVRGLLGLEVEDLGFFFDWLILDMIPNEPMSFDPPAWQLCDPERPTTIVPGGPGRRRWEFMALPGEDINDLNKAETAWEFLKPWGLTPDNAVLERHTVYRFQAHWAKNWRHGRGLIAGDAAHLMPPFAGQGMCGGLRDAANLAWKLDMVLTGKSDDVVLDSYGPERAPHVRYFIDFSIELGKVICVPDKADAAQRDVEMMAAIENPQLAPAAPPPPRLGDGVLAPGDDHAGLLSIQSRVSYGGQTGLFDDVVGRGWFVLTTTDNVDVLEQETTDILGILDAQVLRIRNDEGTQSDLVDLDGRYTAWFEELGADTIVIRPDFYVYAALEWDQLGATIRGLADQLSLELRLEQSGRP